MEKDIFYCEAGQRIRNLRESKKYTRESFSEIADISPKFLYEIETGSKGFTAKTLDNISRGLEVSPEYLLKGDAPVLNIEIATMIDSFDKEHQDYVYKILIGILQIIKNSFM